MKKLTKIYLNKSKNNMVMSKKLSSIFQRFDQGDRVTYVAAFDKEQAVAIMLAFDKDKKLTDYVFTPLQVEEASK